MEKGIRWLFLFSSLKIRINNVESERDVIESEAKIILSSFIQEGREGFVVKIADGQFLHVECCCKDGNFKGCDIKIMIL
jgi:hypothetical protein